MQRTGTPISPRHRGSILRHPLTITVVGFVLTGLIGAGFSWYLNSLSSAGEIERTAYERAVQAVREMSDLLFERRERAVLVASSITRQAAAAEVTARKLAYDDVYVRWNTKLPSLSLRIRDEIFRQVTPTEYEGYIAALTYLNKSGQRGYLALMDTCLTKAYDAYAQGQADSSKSAIAILDQCKFKEMNVRLMNCSELMVESLHTIVNMRNSSKPTGEKRADAAAIEKACNPPSQ